MDLPLVSIVIPVYNREGSVFKAIQSALEQSYGNIEVVVCDNASTDGTWKLLEQYQRKEKRLRIYRNETNLGPVRNWERCFSHAKGDYLKIIWSDDWIDSRFVEQAMMLLDRQTAFVMSGVQVVDDFGHQLFEIMPRKSVYGSREYLDDILYFRMDSFPKSPGCALFRTEDVRKSLIERVPNEDGLDSSLNGAGNDLLLFLCSAVKYKTIKVIREPLSFFVSHKNSFSCQHDMSSYYEWARLYFIRHYYSNTNNYILKYLYSWKEGTSYRNLKNDVPMSGARFGRLFLFFLLRFKRKVWKRMI